VTSFQAKSGSKSLEEKRTELEKHRKELEEIETMRAALEGKKNQAEESEREAKKKQDDAWNGIKTRFYRRYRNCWGYSTERGAPKRVR
jgi:predicted  nucleic acid-binding Zn-ribbon protein